MYSTKVSKPALFFKLFTFRSRGLHDGTSSNTVNNQYLSYGSHEYSRNDTHYHSINSVYYKAHDEDDDSLANPYLTPTI